MIKEWILSKILKNKIVLFEKNNEYYLINDIYFNGDIMICSYYKQSEINKTKLEDIE